MSETSQFEAQFSTLYEQLCKAHNRPFDQAELVLLVQFLTAPGASEADILEGIAHVWATREFWPRPIHYLEPLMERDWSFAQQGTEMFNAISGAHDSVRESMSDMGIAAVSTLGGFRRMKDADQERLRKRFLEAWTAQATTVAIRRVVAGVQHKQLGRAQ